MTVDLAEWPQIASSGIRATMIDGGKYREQRMTVHRHADGRILVAGVVTVADKIVAERQEIGSEANAERLMRDVAGALHLDEYIFSTCYKSFTDRA